MDYLINYADSEYKSAQRINSWTGRHVAHFDKVYSFGPENVEESFRQKYNGFLSYQRGNGLWLWKPYFIDKVMSECKDGDYIFYLDSGAFFIRDPHVLFEYMDDEHPIFITDIPLIESCWTKPICFDIMNAHDFENTNQIQATYLLMKVNKYSREFVRKWLDLCCKTDMLYPEGLGKYEIPTNNYGNTFVSHREDQSILSLLCKKEGISPHRDISQRGTDPWSYYNEHYAFKIPDHPGDSYKTILFLHKSRNLGLAFWLRYFIKKYLRCSLTR